MEVYGQKPKRFTLEWWKYFWYYYKWHTIGIAAVIIGTVFTCVQCATKEKYDFTVLYTGNMIFTNDQADALTSALDAVVPDADGNGETNIYFQQLTLSGQDQNIDYDYTVSQKFDVELMMGESMLFLMSEDEVKNQFARQYTDYVFEPIENWAQTPVPRSAAIDHNGTPSAVSLKGSTFLENIGFYTDDLYLVVRIKEDGAKELYQNRYDAAVKAANILIEGIDG